MANTLTNLLQDIYAGLDVVSREMCGLTLGVNRNSGVERAAIGQTVYVPVAPSAAAADNTPAVTAPDTGDQTIGTESVTISKSRHVPVRWSGEETLGLNNSGTYLSINADRIAQGMRTLVNEMETDLATVAKQRASRAYGTAGTTPFATVNNMTDFAGVRRILEENGSPTSDLQLGLGHAAIANLRGIQAGLFRANEAGSSDMLRNGMTDRVQGFAIRHSDGIGVHTKGTGTSYLLNDASSAIGDTTIALDTGSGTVIAGDVITFATLGAAQKYVVNTALAAGSMTIGKPGLQAAVADDEAMTVGNNYTANVAFDRAAVVLATRMPALPQGGDAASDRLTVTDPKTGISFEIAVYPQFRQSVLHVSIAWGYAVVKPDHVAILLG